MIFGTLALYYLSDGNLRGAELVMLAEVLTHCGIAGALAMRAFVHSLSRGVT